MMADDSRRSVLTLTAAGSAATLPAVAFAASDCSLADPVQLSDREQLDACMQELQIILGRMHAAVTKQTMEFEPRDDGTYRIWTHCEREFLPWSGPGLYRISQTGNLADFWVYKIQRRNLAGKVYCEDFEGFMWLELERRYLKEPRFLGGEPRIVEKLKGNAPC